MPPKPRLDAKSLNKIARDACKDVIKKKSFLKDAELVCKYRDDGNTVTSHTKIRFEWHVKANGFESWDTVSVKAYNAKCKGVPLPPSWRVALECVNLDNIALMSADVEKAKTGLMHLSCSVPSTYAQLCCRLDLVLV